MVTYLPTGLEDLAKIMGSFGSSAGQALFADDIRLRQLRDLTVEDPARAAALARMVESGGAEELASHIGLNGPKALEFLQGLPAAFPATFDQRVEQRLLETSGAVEAFAGAQMGEAETAIAEQGARKGTARVQERQAEAALTFNLPETEAAYRVLEMEVGGEELQNRATALKEFEEMLPTLSPHERQIAVLSMRDPATLVSHITAHEEMNFRERLARIQAEAAAQNQGLSIIERMKLSRDMRGEMRDALDRVRAAEEDGDRDAKMAAIVDVNNIARDIRYAQQQGVTLPGEIVTSEAEKRFLRSSGISLNVEEPMTPVQLALNALITGEKTLQDLAKSNRFSTEERAQIIREYSEYFHSNRLSASVPEAGAELPPEQAATERTERVTREQTRLQIQQIETRLREIENALPTATGREAAQLHRERVRLNDNKLRLTLMQPFRPSENRRRPTSGGAM